MKIRDRLFPYPVVRDNDNDDVDAAFQAPIEVRKVGDIFEVHILCQMSSLDLEKRIDTGEAAYGLHVECTRSVYRSLFRFVPKNGRATVRIDTHNLMGPVELNVVIFATKEIPKYRISGAHPDYGNRTFYVSAGDYLAIAEGTMFNADIHKDMLESISSIIQIHKRKDQKKEVGVDWSGEKIVVLLPVQDYGIYCHVRSNSGFIPIQLCALVFPVLMQALDFIRHGASDFENLRWFCNLRHRLSQKGLDANQPSFENAQKILDFPILQMLEKMNSAALSGGSDVE